MSVDIDEHGQYENIRVSIRVRPESLVERNEGECLTVIADAVTIIVRNDLTALANWPHRFSTNNPSCYEVIGNNSPLCPLVVFDYVERLIFSQVAAKFRSIFVTRCTK